MGGANYVMLIFICMPLLLPVIYQQIYDIISILISNFICKNSSECILEGYNKSM